MILKTFSPNGSGTIVMNDDDTDDDIYKAMYLDATEQDGNGKTKPKKKEETDG